MIGSSEAFKRNLHKQRLLISQSNQSKLVKTKEIT